MHLALIVGCKNNSAWSQETENSLGRSLKTQPYSFLTIASLGQCDSNLLIGKAGQVRMRSGFFDTNHVDVRIGSSLL